MKAQWTRLLLTCKVQTVYYNRNTPTHAEEEEEEEGDCLPQIDGLERLFAMPCDQPRTDMRTPVQKANCWPTSHEREGGLPGGRTGRIE